MYYAKIAGVILMSLLFIACSTSQKFQATTTTDKPLFAAINALNKHPENVQAQKDLAVLYPQALERHEEAITIYRNSNEDNRWEKIIKEINALQHIYNSVVATPGTSKVLKPKSYLSDLQTAKEEAAEDYYNEGVALLREQGRQNSLHAYEAFKRANHYINGYKDVKNLMHEAREKSIVNVVINSIEDNNVFFSGGGGFSYNDFRYRPDDYQEMMVRELGGKNSNHYAARFYTDREARRDRVDPDWIVDIRWRNVDARRTMPQQYSRQVSKNVQVGTDTAGKARYQMVYATLHITQRAFEVRGDLDYRITDLLSNRSIDQGILTDAVSWSESYASYTGDSRALSSEDWYLVNNRSGYNNGYNTEPSRGDILNSLMRKLYPDLRRRIENAVR